MDKADLASGGSNPYFILEPGYQLVYKSKDGDLTITVLNETKVVDGVETRVVEERENEDGRLIEVSRNYFAISRRNNGVFYFGEDVDIYDKNGKVIREVTADMAVAREETFGPVAPVRVVASFDEALNWSQSSLRCSTCWSI